MKTKPTFTGIAGIILLAFIFVFISCRHTERPEKADITKFLYGFSNRINEGNAKALLAMFEVKRAPKTLKRLVGLLSGKKDFGGKEKPVANIKLDVDASAIKIVDDEIVVADIPAKFIHDSLESKNSILTLRIHKVKDHKFKIIQIDVRKFLADYTEYANYVKSKTISDKDLFSPVTLAAFKTAGQLKAKYDSVVWFSDVGGQTFFYVVKGNWDIDKEFVYKNTYKDSVKGLYKMGLVNSDLKEIIPVKYDLIHNIGGTLDGMIEVELDNKKGLCNLEGTSIVAVKYDQIFPLNNDQNLALLRDSNDYFYLKRDFTISDKLTNFKIADVFHQIKINPGSYSDRGKNLKNIIELNSRFDNHSPVVPPSYLVDLKILPQISLIQNPLRHITESETEESEGSLSLDLKYDGSENGEGNWFESSFYSLIVNYVGGRGFLYQEKKVVVADKRQNRIFSYGTGIYGQNDNGSEGSLTDEKCNENYLKAINDTLFEFKTTSYLNIDLYNQEYEANVGPYYYYLHVKNGKLEVLPNKRVFGFTKYVKMDDSYLKGCFEIGDKQTDHMTPEILRYVKNEIFASYKYKFKDDKWNKSFEHDFNRDKGAENVNVDDSLTEIEKYNVQWINSKLNKPKSNRLAAK